ncbi:hypothetical protein RND81_03G169300 [Saponaria officinalis]|uniref:DUF3615 domain-containing protein n=1 Tax=Saponaria officinalis TaxID=3572 RepID=A0AAW1MBC8_SAPOF
MKGQTSKINSGSFDMYRPGYVYTQPDSRFYEPSRPDYETPSTPPEKVAADLLRQASDAAEGALVHYNKKHLYEFVDPIASSGHLYSDGIWIHCNFTAKAKTSEEDKEDPPSKLFFAELKVAKPTSTDKYLVTTCRPIDGIKTTLGCEMCSGISHPTRGFRKGRYVYNQRLLRPRNGGKVVK